MQKLPCVHFVKLLDVVRDRDLANRRVAEIHFVTQLLFFKGLYVKDMASHGLYFYHGRAEVEADGRLGVCNWQAFQSTIHLGHGQAAHWVSIRKIDNSLARLGSAEGPQVHLVALLVIPQSIFIKLTDSRRLVLEYLAEGLRGCFEYIRIKCNFSITFNLLLDGRNIALDTHIGVGNVSFLMGDRLCYLGVASGEHIINPCLLERVSGVYGWGLGISTSGLLDCLLFLLGG